MEFPCLVCERFRRELADHFFEYDGRRFQLTVSIGLSALNTADENAAEQVFNRADTVLYEAKQAGRNGWPSNFLGKGLFQKRNHQWPIRPAGVLPGSASRRRPPIMSSSSCTKVCISPA